MRFWAVVVCVGLGGCQAIGLSCTMMGCSGLLTVNLDREPIEGAVVEVDLGDGEVILCASGAEEAGCVLTNDADGASLEIRVGMGQAPDAIVVTVAEGDEVTDYDVPVTWGEPFFPNGRACDGADGGCAEGEGDLAL